MDYIWLGWDLLAVLIMASCIWICAARGFLRTVVGLLSWLIALAAARYLGTIMADLLYEYMVRDILIHVLQGHIEATIQTGQEIAEQYLSQLPELLQLLLPKDLLAAETIGLQVPEIASDIVDSALRHPVLFLLQSLCFMLVMTVMLFLTHHLARLLTQFNKVPVLGSVNIFMGGVLGVVQALLFLALGGLLMAVVVVSSGNRLDWLNGTIMDKTYIWRPFYLLMTEAWDKMNYLFHPAAM